MHGLDKADISVWGAPQLRPSGTSGAASWQWAPPAPMAAAAAVT